MASVPQSPPPPQTPRTSSTPRTPTFNTKSPSIKRILSESRELASHPDPTLHAGPLDSDLFEWHFTLSGPPSTPYASGIYHGRISLPPSYPLRPPSFRFLTPSGRFETNREICLSISGHHEETWQPAWGIRTALCAIRAFMAGAANGQVGGLDMSQKAREKLAAESRSWRCAGGCSGGKTNEEILRECEDESKRLDNGGEGAVPADAKIPEELRLAYKDDLERSPPTPTGVKPGPSGPSFEPPATQPARTAPETWPRIPERATPTNVPAALRAGPVANLLARAKPPPSPLRDKASASDTAPTPGSSTVRAPAPARGAPAAIRTSNLHPRAYLQQTPATAAYGRIPMTAAPTPMTGTYARTPGLMTPRVQVVPPTPTTPGGTVERVEIVEGIPRWVDKVIVGLIATLVVMVVRKLMN